MSAELRNDVDAGTASLEEIIEANRGFVITVARQYRHLGVPFEDLLNAGHLGLLEAARRFDASRGARFVTYAVWWIRKAMLEAVSVQSAIVFLPAYQRRLARREEAGQLRASVRHRQPPVATIREVHLDARHERADGPPQRELPAPRSFDPELAAIRGQQVELLQRALQKLPEREREVIRHRFGLDGEPVLALQEIGAKLGLSRERVRQIEIAGLARLRTRLTPARRLQVQGGRPAGADLA